MNLMMDVSNIPLNIDIIVEIWIYLVTEMRCLIVNRFEPF